MSDVRKPDRMNSLDDKVYYIEALAKVDMLTKSCLTERQHILDVHLGSGTETCKPIYLITDFESTYFVTY